ncbi:MAG: ATP-binding protein [Terriglobia bacterium]|nr:ATP-binding protein [Terriglobia bacterium]
MKMTDNPTTDCPHCGGLGVTLVRRDGEQFAAECVCRIDQKAKLRLKRARIPERYTHCSLESFDAGFRGADPSLAKALMNARGFAKAYPLETAGRGLLLTGSIGCGKTHLAVGLLIELINQRAATGIFCDYRDLLKQIQNSYNSQVATTEMGILRPLFEADVLLLDELGAAKRTDWVWDTVAHVLNTRYNDKRTTLITTNFPNLPPALVKAQNVPLPVNDAAVSGTLPGRETARTMGKESLGDRIGEEMRSRLQEMCIVVPMYGDDLRQTVRRANFL